MNHFILIFFLFAFSLVSKSQALSKFDWGTYVGIPKGVQIIEMVRPDWQARTIEAGASWNKFNGVNGNTFYSEEWDTGYVLLQDNRIAKNISLRFNVYTNEIYYMEDSKVLVLDPTVSVAEFGLYEQTGDTNKISVFCCGYPTTGSNTDKTFYHVLVRGRITFLKHYIKKIMERNNSIGVPERTFIDSETWYIYDASENKMIEFKKNKNALLAALPQYSNKIRAIIQEKHLKLKGETEWVMLFNELNQYINPGNETTF